MIEPAHDRLSIAAQCRLLSVSRSSYHYAPVPERDETLALMRVIDAVFLDCPRYGSRQMARYLRRAGHDIRRGPARRLMAKMGLAPIYQRPRTSDPHPAHRVYPCLRRQLAIKRPNHVWCADITYIPMRRGFLYLVAIMDWATRKVLAWRLSNTMGADFCVACGPASKRYPVAGRRKALKRQIKSLTAAGPTGADRDPTSRANSFANSIFYRISAMGSLFGSDLETSGRSARPSAHSQPPGIELCASPARRRETISNALLSNERPSFGESHLAVALPSLRSQIRQVCCDEGLSCANATGENTAKLRRRSESRTLVYAITSMPAARASSARIWHAE